ncbi:hypothetical protein AB0B50_30695 [Streptomyces sp. NPDC041068]|uniref:hypothetical protein n=1 Tax=Streptomyces sp. NPDC041068 TaxID=3155130 RepID=UPI0033ED11DE
MTDLIARLVARLLCLLLFPADGRPRTTLVPGPVLTPDQPPRPALSEHKSPYAREAAEHRPFVDTINPVRPYVTAPLRRCPDDPKRVEQAQHRWELEMHERGFDVGPTVIHGVHIRPGGRTLRVAVGV